MSRLPSLSVALPAYNEESNLPRMVEDVLEKAGALSADLEVIIVDDGSRDRTAAVGRELAQRHPAVRLVSHPQNRGYGAAVWTGLTSAQKETIFFTDSDRQFDLAELGKLAAALDDADLAVGYRSPRRDPFMRRLNGWGWSRLVTLLFGYTARDIDCAFKLMRRSVVDRLREQVQSRGAAFSAELLVRAKAEGFRILEVPIHGHRPRVAGSPTGARPAVIFRAFRELLSFRATLRRESRPVRAT